MSMRRVVSTLLLVASLGGCSLDSITFLPGQSDAAPDTSTDAPIDGPSGPLGIKVVSTTLSVTEGQTKGLGVSLTQAPSSTVLVTLASSDDTRIGLNPTAVLFSTTDWSTVQNVIVTGKQDADTADEAGTITLSSTAVSAPIVVNTSVVDDDGLAFVLSSPSLDVGEGATGTVSVHLSAQPVANVTVMVVSSSGTVATTSQNMLTFTPANYAIDQTITVTGMQDGDTVDNNAMVDFSATGITTASLAIKVADDDRLQIIPSVSALPVTEGSSRTFTVQLNLVPPATTTVTLASASMGVATVSPSTLTFTTANYNVPQTVTVTGTSDDDVADNSTMITLSATGITSRDVAIDVTDDDVQAIISNPATTVTVSEGGTSQLAFSLAFRPTAPVTLSVNSLDPSSATVNPNTLTFSTSNYASPQMVTVTGAQDADAVPDLTSVRADSALLGLTKDVTVSVTDDDTLAIEASTTTVAVTEGNMTTFTVRLTAQPTADTTVAVTRSSASITATPDPLTFTAANWNVPQTVTVRGVEDPNLVGEAAQVTLSSTGLSSVIVAVTVTDNDTQAIVAPAMANVTEGQTTQVGITLAFIPTANVTVTVGTMNAAVATVAPATLTFTPANYDVPQNITISGTQDADALAGTTMVSLTSASATAAAIMVNVTDDDALNIELNPTSLIITEGTTGTIGVRLTAQPAATTTVMIASGDTGAVTVAPAMLTFTTANFATYQNVTVTGVEDLDAADENVTVTASSTGLTPQTATVRVTDNDQMNIAVTASSVTLSEAGMATFGVHLTAQPLANTTVTVTSGDVGAASVSPATLTFTSANYAMDQTVTVSGVEDLDVANEAVTISAASAGLATVTVTANVTDNDTQAIQVTPATLTVGEGASANVNVRLAFQPAGPVVVNVASVATGVATVSPATLTFDAANYSTTQAVSISGTEDPDAANGSTTVNMTLSGATPGAVAVTVLDNDPLDISLTPTNLTVVEGSSGVIKVKLTAQPPANTTVAFSSSNTAKATVAPASLVFTTANWNVTQDVTVSGVEDPDTVADTITFTATSAGLTTKTASVTVNDNDILGIAASPTNLFLTEGGTSQTFNVHLTALPAGNVTVTINNPDTTAVSVSTTSLLFTPANYNVDQAVTVTSVQDNDVGGEVVPIGLSAPGLANVTVTANVTDDDIQQIIVTPGSITVNENITATLNVSLAFAPVGTTTVSLASSNTAVIGTSATSLTFTAANFNVLQPVTLTPVADADFNFNTAQINVTSPGITSQVVPVTVREPGLIDAINNPFPSFCPADGTSVGIRLAGNPLGPVTLNITTTAAVSATPTSLVFDNTNFSTYQNVDITSNSTGSATLTARITGLSAKTTTFTVLIPTSPTCLFQ